MSARAHRSLLAAGRGARGAQVALVALVFALVVGAPALGQDDTPP